LAIRVAGADVWQPLAGKVVSVQKRRVAVQIRKQPVRASAKASMPFPLFLNPDVAKAGGLQSQGAKGEAVAGPTAIPWQRRIWSPPAFPQGKKDGLK